MGMASDHKERAAVVLGGRAGSARVGRRGQGNRFQWHPKAPPCGMEWEWAGYTEQEGPVSSFSLG